MSTAERVPDWPRILAGVQPDGTGTVRVNGVERACAAESVEGLRTGIIARAVAIATALGRPVQLHVTEGGAVWPLAVRPNGVVHALSASATVPTDNGLSPAEGRCRGCRRLQSVAELRCARCGISDPHAVGHEGDGAAEPAVAPTGSETAAPYKANHTPALRLRFSSQPTVTVAGRAVLGRRPAALDGRLEVTVVSPEQMVSRTHVLVDVDAAGRVLITDHHSGNGTRVLTAPPVDLRAGVPYAIEPGTTIQLGDVMCTIDLEIP